MARPVKDLEPGSMYVTISIPYALVRSTPIPPITCRRPNESREVNIATYETHCAQHLAQEEFSWGLYFHRAQQDGIWYNLRRQDDDTRNRSCPSLFSLHRQHESYATATRTFIWVTSMYLRTWHHATRLLNNPNLAYGSQFDVNLFLREALNFSYENAEYALGGQLPRPIIQSAYGTELGIPAKHGVKQSLVMSQQHALTQPKPVPGSSS
ncbi:hypothetical protein E4U42_005108 [Claviceps africana]|uniref:Uncharacterized protein n=1 Tax=Claviceps africana TaxID=83212 RepID=A0A8K0JHR2_9HYPO|nr:hypothetical protein E4U42_005108 [Claviceps africana]